MTSATDLEGQPLGRPASTGQRRRSSDELTAAEAPGKPGTGLQGLEEPRPVAIPALGSICPNRAAMCFGHRCESPDFGVKAPSHPMDWSFAAPPPRRSNFGTRLKTDYLAPKGAYNMQDVPVPVQKQAGQPNHASAQVVKLDTSCSPSVPDEAVDTGPAGRHLSLYLTNVRAGPSDLEIYIYTDMHTYIPLSRFATEAAHEDVQV